MSKRLSSPAELYFCVLVASQMPCWHGSTGTERAAGVDPWEPQSELASVLLCI